jgi:porin
METNPASFFLSAGLAGHSLMKHRTDDRFGAGWFYYGTSREIAPFVEAVVGPIRDGQGVELFYNFVINKRMSITADTQVLQSALADVDTASFVGLRANVSF